MPEKFQQFNIPAVQAPGKRRALNFPEGPGAVTEHRGDSRRLVGGTGSTTGLSSGAREVASVWQSTVVITRRLVGGIGSKLPGLGAISELIEKSHIVFKEQADVFDAVLSHGDAFHAQAKGETGVLFGVNMYGLQYIGIDHSAPA